MFNPKRRNLFLAVVSLLLFPAASGARNKRDPLPLEEQPGPLFAAALQFIVRRYVQQERLIVHGPVSLLQREFLLGYTRACELAVELQRFNVWVVSEGPHGRFATIDPTRLEMFDAIGTQ